MYGEPNFAAEQPGDTAARAPGWSYHAATSLTPEADLCLAAKRKVVSASRRSLKNTSKKLPQHEELESPKVGEVHDDHEHDAISSTSRSAEAGQLRRSLLPLDPSPSISPTVRPITLTLTLTLTPNLRRSLLPLDFTLQPQNGSRFFASQRLLDLMDPRRGLYP